MNSGESSPEKGTQPVRLEYRGDHIPSFKNQWKPAGNRVILDQATKDRKQAIEDSFASQLLCVIATRKDETPMGHSPRYLMRLLMPLDDCWTEIPEISIKCELVPKGQEGCVVVVERIG